MHVSLQFVKKAEIREGLIRSSDDLYSTYTAWAVEVTAKRQGHP
jgi:hypothetical protein